MSDLQRLAERLGLPQGYRAEVVNGSMVISRTPAIRDARIIGRLQRAIDRSEAEGLDVLQAVTVEIAETGERYVPDLVAIPESVAEGKSWEGPDWIRPAEGLEPAVEVVSPSSRLHDWQSKVKGYATAGVPLYLVIDPRKSEIALFSNPDKGEYKDVGRAVRGASVKLPDPFNIEIEATPLLT
jgi:Uma2 family endonuclease